MLAVALLTSAGLWLIAHRHPIADLLARDGLIRQSGIEGREDKITSHGLVLSAGLLSYSQLATPCWIAGKIVLHR